MITFKFLRCPFVVFVLHTVNEHVTDIILNNTSQEDLMLTLLHIGSRLFELFGKEVCVKKQPGRSLRHLMSKDRKQLLIFRVGVSTTFYPHLQTLHVVSTRNVFNSCISNYHHFLNFTENYTAAV